MMTTHHLKLNGIPLHVSQVCIFECKRRVLKTILGLAKGVEFPFNENHYMLAGSILHTVLQESFKFNFGQIEYFYYNKGLELQNALQEVLKRVYHRWKRLFDIQLPSALWVDEPDSIMKVDDICTSHLPSLAKASKTLISQENDSIQSLVLGEEFRIFQGLKSGAVLVGRIDLFARTKTPKKYRIIELKTGQTRRSSDNTQLKLYGEIFSRSYPDYEFDLELWYTRYKRDIIRPVDLDGSENNLSIIDALIEQTKNIRSIDQLPPPGDLKGLCQYSYNCNICSREGEIFGLDDLY